MEYRYAAATESLFHRVKNMTLIFFVFGLILGSFLNVVVYRLNLSETIMGRSHCPSCKKKIRWHDNIPVVSFLALGAKCRDCGEKISWKYPMLELLTGVVFALVGHYFFTLADPASWFITAYYLVLFFLLLVIFAYDLSYMEIPMVIFWIAVFWSIGCLLVLDAQSFNALSGVLDVKIYSGLLAGTVFFLIFFLLSAGSREKWMGMGDAYLAFLLGFVVGIKSLLWLIILSSLSGSLFGVALVLLKKKTLKSRLPFAPFMVAAAIAVILLNQALPEMKYWLF